MSGSGRFGKHAGTGLSNSFPPIDCTVITMGSFNPWGSGPGSRSGGTGAIPTIPPWVPFSLYSEPAGTMSWTSPNSGCAASTDGAMWITVGWLALTT